MDPSTESLVWVVVIVVGGILFFVGLMIKEVFSSACNRNDDEHANEDEESRIK